MELAWVANKNRGDIAEISVKIDKSKSQLDKTLGALGSLQEEIATMQNKGIYASLKDSSVVVEFVLEIYAAEDRRKCKVMGVKISNSEEHAIIRG